MARRPEYGSKQHRPHACQPMADLSSRQLPMIVSHAYDTRTGKLLWQTRMSASANAGPMTYMGKDGRQYVVVAAGGPGNARRPSPRESFLFHQTLVAFAIPKPTDKPLDIVTPYPRHALQPGESLAMDGSGGAMLVSGPPKP